MSPKDSLAVIEIGGKQHVVRRGAILAVDQLKDKEQTVDLVDLLSGGKVHLRLLGEHLTPKVHGLRFKSKVRYIRRKNFRQRKTRISVERIGKS